MTIVIMEISKSKLKSNLLAILREIEAEDTEVIITDRGRPVAKILKYQTSLPTEELFGDLRGNIKYLEDICTPTTEEWGNEV